VNLVTLTFDSDFITMQELALGQVLAFHQTLYGTGIVPEGGSRSPYFTINGSQ
jgi:hypothetical protein